jgi:hypothetical protein
MTEITFGSKGEEAGANKGDEVVVNEPIIETDGDRMTVTVTPEQAEAVRKMLAEKKEAATEEPTKPDYLGDFKSPEEMAKAYQELRAKMSEGPAPTAEEKAAAEKAEAEAKEAAGKKGVDLDKYVEEFAVNKVLTADSYAELEAAGMARDVVDNYIAGRLANQSAETNALYEVAGGEEQYAALIEWGTTNLSEEAQQAYDRLLSEENYAAAGLVLRGFVEQYKAAEGSPPGGINPGGANPSHGVKPFATKTEMIEAINSKPYKNGDRAFVAEVEARMHVSKF